MQSVIFSMLMELSGVGNNTFILGLEKDYDLGHMFLSSVLNF